MDTKICKSYAPVYVRKRNLDPYNEKMRNNPDLYNNKKIQVSLYMKKRYQEDPEYREKQKLRQKEYYQRKKEK